MRRLALLLILFSLNGCAVGAGAEAIVLNDRTNLCRVIRTSTTTWRMCRTHPSVTPELLHDAQLIHDCLRVPLTTAIGTLTGWEVYGLHLDTANQVEEWRAVLQAQCR